MVNWKGEANIVQGLMGSLAGSRDERRFGCFDLDIGGTKHFDGAVGEDSCAVVVTDFPDR
jgi:hypothetical protein